MAYPWIKWYDNFVRIPLRETHMEITEPRRLYQQLAADLKERIEQGVYLVGDKLRNRRAANNASVMPSGMYSSTFR